MVDVLVSDIPEDAVTHLEERSRLLLGEGLSLVVHGLAVAVPEAAAGVLTTGPQPQLLALAVSPDVGDVPADGSGSLPPAMTALLEVARGAASHADRASVTADLCLVPLRDRHGTPRALLFVATTDPTSPLTAVRSHALVTAYAAYAERELRGSYEQQDLDEQARLAEAAREVVRRVTAQLQVGETLPTIVDSLREGFRADRVLVREYPQGPDDRERGHGTPPVIDDEDDVRVLRALCRRLWERQGAVRVGADGASGEPMVPVELAALRRMMYLAEVSTVLVVPIGYQQGCTGHLALGRRTLEREWSGNETRMAEEVGRDLGRAIHNARAFAREQQLTAEMKRVDTAKSSLIATVSHELRGPLTTVVGHLELLQSTSTQSDDLRQALAAMGRGTLRLQRVVGDLTLLSRVGDPNAPPPLDDVDLNRLAREAVDLQRLTAQLSGIELTTVLPGRPVAVRGDAGELDRALGNLLANAIKYGRVGGHVTVAVVERADEALVLVRDDGIGIAPEFLPHLFTEFYRARDQHSLERNGTGLGLAIVQRIVRRHGGRVEVASRPGVGSDFRLYLPRTSAGAARPPAPAGAAGAAGVAAP